MKAQVSIELLFVAVLFTAFFLLMSNYASSFKESSSLALERVNARVIASQIASLANAVCVSRANTSVSLDCPPSKFISINTMGSNSLNVTTGGGFSRAAVACTLNNSLLFSCSRSERICLEYLGGQVLLKKGRCT